MSRIVESSALAKIILIGEHSVVYGKPAIAMPFDTTKIFVRIHDGQGEVKLKSKFYAGNFEQMPDLLDGIDQLVRKIVMYFEKDFKDFNIEIESQIPEERGMGSSAAVAVALTRALYKYFDKDLSLNDLIEWGNFSDTIVHGNPSGIDVNVIAKEESLYYIKGKTFESFPIDLDAYLIIADTGKQGRTKEAVADVRKLVEKDEYRQYIEDLGKLADKAKLSIEKKDKIALGQVMSKAHSLLKKLTVSDPSLDRLVEVALKNKALGAKLTGGGRGGAMIALASNKEDAENIKDSLLKAGAKSAWISYLKRG